MLWNQWNMIYNDTTCKNIVKTPTSGRHETEEIFRESTKLLK